MWEGVGVSSYLLINYWFTRLQANKSAIKAMLMNRVGDYFLTLGLFLIIWVFGTLEFSTVFSLAPFIDQGVLTITCICLLIATMGNSINFNIGYQDLSLIPMSNYEDLFLRILIRLLLVVYIILIHSLQLLGYFNHYYIKYAIVPQSWLQSITAYNVNKHLGILTPGSVMNDVIFVY